MSYNKQYNTRFSGRYNTPGNFVSAGEQYSPAPRKPMPSQNNVVEPSPPVQPSPPKMEEMTVEQDTSESLPPEDDYVPRPYWMKSRLPGVKKISNKERRRRQNENLRRLLTPKNALMVLNEMMLNEPVANQFKVEPAPSNTFKPTNTHSFCADLTIDGNTYQGFGENKLSARNAAAEQAIRDLIIKKMNKFVNSDTGSLNGSGDSPEEGEALPMIQLASFALHKLFTEWECEGHPVPSLRPHSQSASECAPDSSPPAPKVKQLPQNASSLHPCMLLTHMRSSLLYREVCVEGDPPRPVFTMAVDVDGQTYLGKGANKKEGRKQAARAACKALFNITFDDEKQTQ